MKNKYLGVVGMGFGFVGLLVAGVVLWQNRQDDTPLQHAEASVSGAVSQNTIPLGGSKPAAPKNNGLSVTASGASNLGQLGVNQGGSQQQSGGSQSNPAGGQPSGINPASFGEYEKYKNEQNALFGEMQVGSGAELGANKKAAVYYRGWLTNGTLFDESRTGADGKLQPFVFTLGVHQVIPGWEQGLYGMKVGGVRLIIVPPAVGYGAQGQGSIPPNSVLVFQVQLAAVE